MSRCYPYLRSSGSSVVVRNGTRNGNGGSVGPWIESFKLQSKNEKPKPEQVKEKGRDRKVRKQKEEKHSDFVDGKVKRLKNDKCYPEKKFKDSFSNSCLPEGSEEGKAESLDNSVLTEEHDEPMCVYSSDGTQSSKRKRDFRPSSGITVERNILRIRLPSQKQRQRDVLPSKEQSCSTAGNIAESRNHQRETVHIRGKEEQYCSTNYINEELPPPISDSTEEEKVSPSGAHTAIGATAYEPSGANTAIGATVYENEVQRTESMYQSLMDNLASTPLLLQSEIDINNDQEWLFGTKQQRQASKKLKTGDDISCRQSSAMWPHAQYLPEADIYSLPYTIPF